MSNKNRSNKIIVALIGAAAMIISASITGKNEGCGTPGTTSTPIATSTPVVTSTPVETAPPNVSTDEPESSPEPIDGTVNLMDLEPIIGYSNFWRDDITGYEDNLGKSDYIGSIRCANSEYDDKIVYPIDGKYTTLTGDLALASIDRNIEDYIWVEFYSNDKMIGKTEKFTKGNRPITFSIDVSGVTDLGIKPNCSGDISSGYLLTHGFFLS